MKERRRREALGIGLIALGILVSLAVIPPVFSGSAAERNLIGPAGALLRLGLDAVFGVAAVLVGLPAFAWAGWCLGLAERRTAIRASILIGGTIGTLPAAWWLGARALGAGGERAGWLGRTIGELLTAAFGSVGAQLIVVAILISIGVLILGWSPVRTVGRTARAIVTGLAVPARWASVAVVRAWQWVVERSGRARAAEQVSPWQREPEPPPGPEPAGPEPTVREEQELAAEVPPSTRKSRAERTAELPDTGDLSQDEIPPLDLLTLPAEKGKGLPGNDLERLGQVVVDKLRTFRVESRVGGWTTGPVVTQFEIIPAEGVKVGQIAALADDLALALKAPSVRIVAPIPGKGAVGVEVPNPEPEIVHVREILEAPAYRRTRSVLPLALGRDLDGNPYCADLARMPHLLIAGATGTGKSVCINTIVTSLIYRYTPKDLRLLMIDPKMVELVVYSDLPHLRHPVVTDNQDAAAVLRWAVYEMERRYAILSSNACRNILELNARIRRGEGLQMPASRGGGEYTDGLLPFVVLMIDELADLMMTVQAEVETPLAVLAQKARAVGIHLVVATQRPSVNVVTGLIKANFASRIAFRMASKIDSRTILDQNGAESLLGNGDMLFLEPAESTPHRIQGAFITTAETEALIAWYREQAARRDAASREESDILEEVKQLDLEESQIEAGGEILADWDPYFRQAAEIVIHNSSGSTSLLQRRLKIGYGRAARIIDQLHTAGVLGPPDGSKPREVLVSLDQLDTLMKGDDLLSDRE